MAEDQTVREPQDVSRETWWRFLIERGLIDEAGLDRARGLAGETGEGVEWVLVNLGLITETALADAYAAFLGIERIGPAKMPAEPLFADRLNPRFLQHARVIPIEQTDTDLIIAMADPLDDHAARAMVFASEREVYYYVATRSDIEAAILRLYPGETSLEAELDDDLLEEGEIFGDDVGRLRDLASEAPIVRFVNALIARAIELRASDIHLEPTETSLRIRYRIDGVLRDVDPPPRAAGAAIVSRIKIMAGLDIAEHRLPQDGRIRIVVRGRAVDIRVSTSPTAYGESVVLRILDRQSLALDLATLGFAGTALERVESMLAEPHGILLVTGPTGSGKTTTLYAALQRLNTDDRKILTIEDPIEYVLEGINQAQVKPEIGYTFAAALRSFLRQDPDVMMVGEIRDLETGQVSVQAALTGHLILSTLHTNDAPSAVTRLLDMGIEDFLLTATILGIVGQRLVRVLCERCREAYSPDSDVIRRYGLSGLASGGRPTLYRARGCEACGGTGYHGRIAIVEVMTMTEPLGKLVVARHDVNAIRRQAIADGMIPMLQDGLKKALAGVTTLEEVLRVTRDA